MTLVITFIIANRKIKSFKDFSNFNLEGDVISFADKNYKEHVFSINEIYRIFIY